VRVFLIGEFTDLPLHVVAETTGELADAFGHVHGYRFVTRPELEALPAGRDALAAWYALDDDVFREHTRHLQEAIDQEEARFDEMSPAEREAWLRPRLIDAGHHPGDVERMMRDRRRRGFRVVDEETPPDEPGATDDRSEGHAP
jgi:hypothetical protein